MAEPGPRCSFHAHKHYTAAVSALAKAETPEEIQQLEARVEEKRKIYYTTNRGQNYLRRQVMFETDPTLKKQYEQLLNEAAHTRERQLAAYKALTDRASGRNARIKSNDALSLPVKKASIALKHYIEYTGDSKASLSSDSKTLITSAGKLIILANKYTIDMEASEELKNTPSNIWYSTENTEYSSVLLNQLTDHLAKNGYVGVALVNFLSDDVSFLNLEETKRALTVRFRIKNKIGGTTKWVRPTDEILDKLRTHNLPKAKLTKDLKLGTIAEFDSPLVKSQQTVDNIYLSSRGEVKGKWLYIVRRRSENGRKVMTLEARPKNKTFGSYLSENFKNVSK